jgi:conjugal transfer pilus assembly protein TrbC
MNNPFVFGMFRAALVACFCVSSFAAVKAQTLPSDKEIEQQKRAQNARSTQVFSDSPEARSREKKAIDDSKGVLADPSLKLAAPKMPNPPVVAPSSLRVDLLSKQYHTTAPKPDDLFVFISLKMPIESLRRLANDSAKVNAIFVLRGLVNNSWTQTVSTIAQLKNENINVVLDPNFYKKYKVTQVPAVVLVDTKSTLGDDAEGCALPDSYAKATGDVTLRFALEHIVKVAPHFSVAANRYVKELGSL